MLFLCFMSYFVYVAYSAVNYFYVSFSGLISTVGEETDVFVLSIICKILCGFL